MIYKQIPQQNEELKKKLAELNVNIYIPAALVLDNPMNTPLSELNARGGFIIADSIAVPAPYEILFIEKRRVIVAKIAANPAIATFKSYPALAEWMRNNDREYSAGLPFLEIYHPDESVSTEMPIVPIE
jgi:hypothetical protein